MISKECFQKSPRSFQGSQDNTVQSNAVRRMNEFFCCHLLQVDKKCGFCKPHPATSKRRGLPKWSVSCSTSSTSWRAKPNRLRATDRMLSTLPSATFRRWANTRPLFPTIRPLLSYTSKYPPVSLLLIQFWVNYRLDLRIWKCAAEEWPIKAYWMQSWLKVVILGRYV